MIVRQLIAGMPGSGKTTFIAALRHLLLSTKVETALRLDRLADDEAHVNRLEERWLRCESFPRTLARTSAWATFHLTSRGGEKTPVAVPDVSGEAFRQAATSGRCGRSIYDAMVDSEGMLLFTNAERFQDDMTILDENKFARELAGDKQEISSELKATRSAERVTPFNADNIPEGAKLVELLQLVNRRPLRARHRLLAVIVSAWDVAERTDLTPGAWLEANHPMLSQFVGENSDLWSVRVYGVSAQGGALPSDRDALQQVAQPYERIKIVGPDATPHDLTVPMQWLLSHTRAAA